MKKLMLLTMIIAVARLSAQAGGYHGGYHCAPYHSHGASVSFYFGGSPGYYSYAPVYAYPAYYPSYSYDYSGYSYSRPNYAVNGTLFGALTGGLIGSSYCKGWEGAGIGAAAGLVLGGIAEHSARTHERANYAAQNASYSQPQTVSTAPTVKEAPTVSNAPLAPAAPTFHANSSMTSANSLFGR